MIPEASLYPDELDTELELSLVHDSLRVKLLEDYSPGDTIIYIDGDNSMFPSNGYITLTDQCNDPSNRALTFFYGSKTSTTFEELELLEEFTDIAKPKRMTNVTMNVTAKQHNSIKDALIAIQEFVGVKGTTDLRPLGETMEGRVNFLRKLVLRPRAWFETDIRIGIVPLTVNFTNLSFRNPTSYSWNFGDNGISNISSTSTISQTIAHTYYQPGIYDATLTVSNEHGSDSITLSRLIIARTQSPDEAIVSVTVGSSQLIQDIDEDNTFLLEHLVPGIIKSKINIPIQLTVTDNGEQSGDSITEYIWKLNDDLEHANSPETDASFSIGGMYDIRLKVNTELTAYRTTILSDAVEIVEDRNLFLLTFDPDASGVTQTVSSYEFGLLSETFKTNNRNTASVTRNYNFFTTTETNYTQQRREFLRNNGFTNRTNIMSGSNGTAMVYWAEGTGSGSPLSSQTLRCIEYEGFADAWKTPTSFVINRPWNWIGLNSPNGVYFMFGVDPNSGSDSATNSTKTFLDFIDLTTSDTTLTDESFRNGADELLNNTGEGDGGNFSVYRSTWSGSNGFIVRNSDVGNFFRLMSFYKTEGTSSDPTLFTRKLTDMAGNAKTEGQLVTMSQGIYFFNNSGEISVYNDTSSTWATGGPGINSPTFRSLQDTTVDGYDSVSNTLIACSDGDRKTYLSYDYSSNVFLKFNEADLTFINLIPRPAGEQFVCGVF